jgi:hypothetical protein
MKWEGINFLLREDKARVSRCDEKTSTEVPLDLKKDLIDVMQF